MYIKNKNKKDFLKDLIIDFALKTYFFCYAKSITLIV